MGSVTLDVIGLVEPEDSFSANFGEDLGMSNERIRALP